MKSRPPARPLTLARDLLHTVIIDKSASRALFQGRTQWRKDVSQFRSRSKINPCALPRTRIPRWNPKANWSFLARPRSSKARVCKIYFITFLQTFAPSRGSFVGLLNKSIKKPLKNFIRKLSDLIWNLVFLFQGWESRKLLRLHDKFSNIVLNNTLA